MASCQEHRFLKYQFCNGTFILKTTLMKLSNCKHCLSHYFFYQVRLFSAGVTVYKIPNLLKQFMFIMSTFLWVELSLAQWVFCFCFSSGMVLVCADKVILSETQFRERCLPNPFWYLSDGDTLREAFKSSLCCHQGIHHLPFSRYFLLHEILFKKIY